MGITVLTRLQELEVEPGGIEKLSALYRTLDADGTDIQSFVRTGLSLEEIRERTGLGVDKLEEKACMYNDVSIWIVHTDFTLYDSFLFFVKP